MPWTAGTASLENKQLQLTNWKAIFKSLYSVFKLKNSLLLAIIGFLIAGSINYMDILLPIFTVKELGWTDLTYSQVFATTSVVGGIGGMLIGGLLVDKFGKKRMLNIYFFVWIASTVVLVFMKPFWANTIFINGYMFAYSTLSVFCNIGLFAIAMQCCWKKVSVSQFTLYMTISNIGRIAFAALIPPMKANFSWEITLLGFAGIVLVSWVLLQFLNIKLFVKNVEKLENKDIERRGMLRPIIEV